MFQRSPTPSRQGGAVAIMVALSMVILLGAVGLVVDAGLAYLVKARLNAAVDSAALAGARAVTDGTTQAAQIASAQAAAATFFAANIPTSYMLSKPKLLSTNVTFNGGMATIEVTAEAPLPVSFMQVLGFTSLKPVAYAQTIRKDLDMAFVIDTSQSLLSSASTVRSSAKSFLNKFNISQDRVTLIHFGWGAEVDNPINTTARGFNRSSMFSNIDKLNFDANTGSVEGMWNARDQLNSIATSNRSTLRVIVFFSDGLPNAMGVNLPFNNASDCGKAGVLDAGMGGLYRLDDSSGTSLGGTCVVKRPYYFGTSYYAATRLPDYYNAHNDASKREFPIVTASAPGSYRSVTNDISSQNAANLNITRAARNLPEMIAAKAREEGAVVFTLGLGADLRNKSPIDGEVGEDMLKCMANVPDGPSRCYKPSQPVGMYCYAATDADLTPCFSRLASAILRISK